MAKNIKRGAEQDTAKGQNGGNQYFNLDAEKAFFDEVDEEVRNEKFKKLINKYGGIFLALLIIFLSVAVGYEKIGQWRLEKAEQENVRYVQALVAQKDFEDNIAELENIVATESGLYKDMARLQIVNILLDNNQNERGLKNLSEIWQDTKVSNKIREIAAIKLATYKIDSAPYAEIETLLSPIANDANSSWVSMAKELLAMSAIQNKDLEKGRALYQELLTNGNISDDFKARINDVLASINDAQ